MIVLVLLMLMFFAIGFLPIAMTVGVPDGKPAGCLDRRQASQYLSISMRLLDNLASDGEIPRIKIGSKTLFRVVDLDNYVASKVQRLEA